VRKYVFRKKWKRGVVRILDFLGGLIFFPLRFRNSPNEPKSIVVVRLDHVGDMVQALPFFDALRRKYPKANITALCTKSTAFLVEHYPSIDNVIAMESSWFYPEKKTAMQDLLRVSRETRAVRADLAIDLRGDLRNIVFLFLSGATRIYSYGCTGGSFLLSKEFEYRREEHEMDKNLKLIGEKPQSPVAIAFRVNEDAEREAGRILHIAGDGIKIVVHPFTRAASKMWGVEKYRELIERMKALSRALTIFVVGSSDDTESVREFQWDTQLIDCTGKLSFAGTLSLIMNSDVFIGNDSGPQYMAAYSGKKTCVIYGDTVNYLRWKPKVRDEDLIVFSKNVYCGPCESNVCLNKKEGHLCMDIIGVSEVFDAVKKWL
jgi:ADP-heptose:LPS heptosyltransferase